MSGGRLQVVTYVAARKKKTKENSKERSHHALRVHKCVVSGVIACVGNDQIPQCKKKGHLFVNVMHFGSASSWCSIDSTPSLSIIDRYYVEKLEVNHT